MQSLEVEFENLIERYIPDFKKEISGAAEEEILELEKLTGCKLPKFYSWFLSRMGREMGAMSFPTIDFSVTKISQRYRDGLVKPDPRYLLIGHESKDQFLDLYYDLDTENNGDAYVLRFDPQYDEKHWHSETLREFLSWSAVNEFGIERCPEICEGLFIDEDGDVLNKLDPIMKKIGFGMPVKTGKYNGIYFRNETTLITHCSPYGNPGYHGFSLGGTNRGTLRRVLIEIERPASLEIEVDENDPRRLNALD